MCHRAPRMASIVREDQSSIPRTRVKISGMVVHTCTLSASGVNTGGSLCLVLWVGWRPMRPCLKGGGHLSWGWHPRLSSGLYMHVHTRVHTHITKYMHICRERQYKKPWVNVYCCWNRHNQGKASRDLGPLALAKSFPIRLRLLKVKLFSGVRIWATETEGWA